MRTTFRTESPLYNAKIPDVLFLLWNLRILLNFLIDRAQPREKQESI